MGIFSVANRTSVVTSATAGWEIIAGANNAYSAKEVGITLNAATATTLGFGAPGVKGVTPANGSTVQAEDQGNTTAGTTTTGTTWATGPTVPANFFRRVSLPNIVGAGIIWTFPRGINVLKTVTTILWNLAAGSAMDVWVVVDE